MAGENCKKGGRCNSKQGTVKSGLGKGGERDWRKKGRGEIWREDRSVEGGREPEGGKILLSVGGQRGKKVGTGM